MTNIYNAIVVKLNSDVHHIAVVVCPLNALIKNQVERWTKMGVKCAGIVSISAMPASEIEGKFKQVDGQYQICRTAARFAGLSPNLQQIWWCPADLTDFG